jgi:hypothetical protein
MAIIAGQRLNIGPCYGKNIVILVSSVGCNVFGEKNFIKFEIFLHSSIILLNII